MLPPAPDAVRGSDALLRSLLAEYGPELVGKERYRYRRWRRKGSPPTPYVRMVIAYLPDCLDMAREQIVWWQSEDANCFPSICWRVFDVTAPSRANWGLGVYFMARRLAGEKAARDIADWCAAQKASDLFSEAFA